MQQLQMLHQKQLQSVLHHGNHANSYGAGPSGGYSGTSWHPEGPGHSDSGVGAQSYYKQDEIQSMKGPPAPQQGHQPPPPPPPQPKEQQPVPPPPESPSLKPPESNSVPKEVTKKQATTTEEDNALHLQVKSS